MSNKRYPQEFKIEAVRRIVEGPAITREFGKQTPKAVADCAQPTLMSICRTWMACLWSRKYEVNLAMLQSIS
jgi:transposase-like protein